MKKFTKKTHLNQNVKNNGLYKGRIIDLPLKEYQCMIDYTSKKYPSND